MSKTDHVVVIGGTGFIGSRLVQLHLDSGNSVTVVSRTTSNGGSSIQGLEYVRGEAADEQCMRSVINGASVVYDLAMGGGKTWASFQRDFVDSVRGIGQACTDFGVKRLVYVSTSAALYLGDRRRIDESDGPDPKPETRGFYPRGKILAERAINGITRQKWFAGDHHATLHCGGPGRISQSRGSRELAKRYMVHFAGRRSSSSSFRPGSGCRPSIIFSSVGSRHRWPGT